MKKLLVVMSLFVALSTTTFAASSKVPANEPAKEVATEQTSTQEQAPASEENKGSTPADAKNTEAQPNTQAK